MNKTTEKKETKNYNGILCVNKPEDFTSFDVIAKLRGMVKFRKLGHGGTLDPMATGVLPIFFGNATKAVDIVGNFENQNDKEYVATIRFGEQTDTLDRTGTVINKGTPNFSEEQLISAMENFKGEILQTPPMYSAVQVGGRRLYDIARTGEIVEREKRSVTIYKNELLEFDKENYTCKLKIACSKGTYIRAISDDLGKMLGCYAVLDKLERISAYGFTLEDCHTLDEIQKIADNDEVQKYILKIDKMFRPFPTIKLSDEQAKMYKNGVKLDTNRIFGDKVEGDIAVWHKGKLLGVSTIDFEKEELLVKRLLCDRD